MAKGNFGGMPGNMGSMMKQMQKMQKQMEDMQKELDDRVIETTSGGGAVKATMNGKRELLDLIIDEEIVNSDDIEMLQDLIIVCVNSAIKEVEQMQSSVMSKLTGGINIPGLI